MSKKILSKLLCVVMLYCFYVVAGCRAPVPGNTEDSYMITGRILSISEKHYDDMTVMRKRYRQKGVTRVSMRLHVLKVQKGSGSRIGVDRYRVGQTLDVYAYQEMDFAGSKFIHKGDVIKGEVVAVPIGHEAYDYKITKIRKQ